MRRRSTRFASAVGLSSMALAMVQCGKPPAESTASTEPGSSSTASADTSEGTSPGSSNSAAATTTPGASSSGGADDTSDSSSGTTRGGSDCAKNVVLMGYWPPTNEMLRPWSTNPQQNPGAWIGEDWEGYGFDVYAFFPEFPPDGDPTNDAIGDDGAVGSPRFDLRVDYQATSEDFWRLVDTHQPHVLVTTSRGGQTGWEIEALEGGHGQGNPDGPALDWSSDRHGAVQRPTEETIEARSWDAISTHRQGNTLPSQLPTDEIFAATSALGVASVAIDTDGTSGNFLSGFLGLHGLYYQLHAPHAVAAGHIHVGYGLPVEDASALIEQTLHTVLQQIDAEQLECPPAPR